MLSRLPRPTGSAVAAGVVLLWIGAIVAFGFWAIFQDRSEPVDIVEIVGHSDSTELILRVQHRSCEADGPDVTVEEDEVTVGLSARYDASGDCDDVIVESTVVVTLDEPLGSRADREQGRQRRSHTGVSDRRCAVDAVLADLTDLQRSVRLRRRRVFTRRFVSSSLAEGTRFMS